MRGGRLPGKRLAALVMLVLVAAAGLASARALADSNPPSPTDTTPTSPPPPSTTVTVPQPTGPAPAPDPAPVPKPKPTPKPKPKPTPKPVHRASQAQNPTPPPAPVIQSVSPPPAPRPLVHTGPTPTKKIVHARARPRRVHTKKHAHPVARAQTRPTPSKVRPPVRPRTNTLPPPVASTRRSSGGSNLITILVVASVVVLLTALAVVGARRALAQRPSLETEQDSQFDDLKLEAPPTATANLMNGAPGPERLTVLATVEPSQNGQSAERGWWETCEIVWWRGYRRSDFYALAFSPDGEPLVVGRSRDFHWRRNEPPPPTFDIVAAREELVQTLIDDGWEELEPASAENWYAGRYKLWNENRGQSDEPESETAPTLPPANGRAAESHASPA